jgi:hypothetical protein
VSEWLGQDGNYDLQAYHLYNGAALLRGRFGQDLLAAGMQSYLNPLLDAAYAWLALGPLHSLPRVLAAVMGLWYGAAVFLAIELARLLYPGRPVLAALGAGLAVTGVGMVSLIGTTFGEAQTATIMLGGLLAALRPAATRRALGLGGALFGAAAGLKLTASTLAPALLAAACCAAADRRSAARAGALAAAGWLAGFALTDGWWALMLIERFGSPTFPMFNGVFRSPWYPPANFVDGRFLPGSLARALVYPILWLTGPATSISEIPLRDPRGAIVLCLAVANLATARFRRLPPLSRPQRAMLAFLAVGYAAWVSTSGILRYAAVLEVTAGLVTPLLISRLLPKATANLASASVLAVALGTARYGSWGRMPYGGETLRADTGWVQPGTLVVVTLRATLAGMVPFMPHQDSISVIGLDFALLDARGYRLHDEALRRVREHTGPIAVLTVGDPGAPAFELGEIGLDPAMTNCRPVGNSFVTPGAQGPFVCDTRRRAIPHLPSPFWAQAALRYRTLIQPRDAAMSVFGATYLNAAGPLARGTRILDWTDLLWRGVRPQPGMLQQPIDPGALYILDAPTAQTLATRIDPARDALGTVDGVFLLAPGWRTCSPCTAVVTPLEP